ncbi:MAG: hypothetical protein ACI37S_02765 [Candidatus Gastranaerophilaceae bacterium]
MSYKNDGLLVIANKFGAASGDAKIQLYETYDRLRDLTVSGSASSGTGFELAGGALYKLASLFAPSAFMTTMGGTQSFNIPGTSYWSPITGSTAQVNGTSSAFGIGNLGNYSGFPNGAAGLSLSGFATGGAASITDGLLSGLGTAATTVASAFDNSSSSGTVTGGAASAIGGIADIASATAHRVGSANGYGIGLENVVMPLAGILSGWGGIMTAAAPYLGEYGLPAVVMGNLMQGTSSAALAAYQSVSQNILANADTILSNKVRNIETVCKMLDTQGEIVRKMLKEGMDSDSKAIQNL